ncbi:MAG: F0F1 ATP synthase subunit A [Oscillospiraceae bacterium]|nr:F0F1 ATP synthase subunit A [Oscillospiraceae bacterium]
MNVSVTGPYIYFTIPIFGGIPITQTTVSHLLVTIFLCVASVMLGRRLKKRPDGLQVMVEKGVMMLRNMVTETMGEHNAHWTSFIGTIFLSSICGSFIGLSGFLRSSTADLSCTLVWSLMVTAIIWYNNIKYNGFFGWLKGFTKPIAVMTPMNIISEIAQPVSMAFRHFGNVAGGGVITGILYSALSMASAALLSLITASGWIVPTLLLVGGIALLVLWRKQTSRKALIFGIIFAATGLLGILEFAGILSGVPFLAYGIPAVLSCYFDLFSGFVQAYVFSLLTMVYISASLPEPKPEESETPID